MFHWISIPFGKITGSRTCARGAGQQQVKSKEKKMKIELLIPLVITTFVAILGWYIAHRLNVSRDRANKKRDLQIQYLIEAYRRLERASNRPKNYDNNAELESAIADIQLFGTAAQVKLAEKFSFDITQKSHAPTDELLINLRAVLRKELGLEEVNPQIVYLRLDENQ